MELSSFFNWHGICLFIFALALGLGLGATVLWNALFLFAASDKRISKDEFGLLKKTRVVVWGAVFLYGLSGFGLLAAAYETMFSLGIFHASMTIAAILIANEWIFSFYYVPRLRRATQERDGALDAAILISGVLSVASWAFLTLHHTIHRAVSNYFLFLMLYAAVVFLGIFAVWLLRRSFLGKKGRSLLRWAAVAAWVVAVFLGFGWVATREAIEDAKFEGKISEVENNAAERTAASKEKIYSVQDVALHKDVKSCWLIIDGKVFDATEAARAHPALFNCGTDASDNYHQNHGKGISERMMRFYIGELDASTVAPEKKEVTRSYDELNPTKELYVKINSWNPQEMMVVVEKDAEKLLFIDGRTHTEIGRIHNIGFQPHTSVFSPDEKYMYIISRDGWLSKIELATLDPLVSVRVGEKSRGTALTDDGRFLAIGNFEPHTLVILDTLTMQIIQTIAADGEVNGEKKGSRVGVVVEKGQDFILALKDLNGVWVVGQDEQGEWVVKNKYWNIGGNQTPLHDGYLTPDGAFFIVAAQGADVVWVLNVKTWEVVGEIGTGKLPHTGPGATWKNTTYIPSLEEGLITAIDTETWQSIAKIKTGGPGLFVRSYSKNENYPYIWADTAFGDRKDEIYVIDARTNKIAETLVPVAGKNSWHPEFTYDGKFVYVVSQEGGEVVVYDAHTFVVAKRISAHTPSAVSNVGLRIEEPGL